MVPLRPSTPPAGDRERGRATAEGGSHSDGNCVREGERFGATADATAPATWVTDVIAQERASQIDDHGSATAAGAPLWKGTSAGAGAAVTSSCDQGSFGSPALAVTDPGTSTRPPSTPSRPAAAWSGGCSAARKYTIGFRPSGSITGTMKRAASLPTQAGLFRRRREGHGRGSTTSGARSPSRRAFLMVVLLCVRRHRPRHRVRTLREYIYKSAADQAVTAGLQASRQRELEDVYNAKAAACSLTRFLISERSGSPPCTRLLTCVLRRARVRSASRGNPSTNVGHHGTTTSGSRRYEEGRIKTPACTLHYHRRRLSLVRPLRHSPPHTGHATQQGCDQLGVVIKEVALSPA